MNPTTSSKRIRLAQSPFSSSMHRLLDLEKSMSTMSGGRFSKNLWGTDASSPQVWLQENRNLTPLSSGMSKRRFYSTPTSSNGNFGDFPWESAGTATGKGSVSIVSQPLAAMQHSNGSQLLDEASAECIRILDQMTQNSTNLNKSKIDVASSIRYHQYDKEGEVTQHKLRELEDAVDSLLAATKVTIPLARVITHSPNDKRVHSLHRSFLSIFQKCMTALSSQAAASKKKDERPSKASSQRRPTPIFPLAQESPLLDKTLRLAVRAREDLGLPFHLPLYQLLASRVAESSSSPATISKWVLQAGRWAKEDFGSLCIDNPDGAEEFFARPIWHLAERRRYSELNEIILVLLHTKDFEMQYLQETTLEGVFDILYDDFRRHIWEPPHTKTSQTRRSKKKQRYSSQHEYSSQDAAALEELLMLLEPSIWKVFGFTSAAPEGTNSLRDVIDVLLPLARNGSAANRGHSGREHGAQPMAVPNTAELLQALFPDEFPDDSDDFLNYDEDNDDLAENSSYLSSGNATWEFQVDMDSDLAVVGLTRVFGDEDDDHDDDDCDSLSTTTTGSSEMIYTRSRLPAKLPDVVHQVEQITGKPLQYSKALERDLFEQMVNPYERGF